MDDPLGVIYLFGSRLSAAPADAKAQVMMRFPAVSQQYRGLLRRPPAKTSLHAPLPLTDMRT